jgi:disulfide bond formation protein DsbB
MIAILTIANLRLFLVFVIILLSYFLIIVVAITGIVFYHISIAAGGGRVPPGFQAPWGLCVGLWRDRHRAGTRDCTEIFEAMPLLPAQSGKIYLMIPCCRELEVAGV